MGLVTWPLNESDGRVDLVFIETSLLFFNHVYAIFMLVISRNLHTKISKIFIKMRSTPASLSFKCQATKDTISNVTRG